VQTPELVEMTEQNVRNLKANLIQICAARMPALLKIQFKHLNNPRVRWSSFDSNQRCTRACVAQKPFKIFK